MISKATDHKATVLMNRRMNTERRVTTFGPVCSSVAGMALHHLEGRHGVQEGSASVVAMKCATLSRVVIWSSLINPAMDCARDERISQGNRSSPHCHPKSEMGTVSDDKAGFAKCVSECDFD